MKSILKIIFLFSFSSAWICSSLPNNLFIHEKARYSQDLLEKRNIIATSTKTNPVSDRHRVTIAIKQQHLDELERILYEVSIPTSPKYGQHWTKEQVDAFTSNPTGTEKVMKWLSSYDDVTITHVSTSGSYIHIEAPVSRLADMLQTEFFEMTLVRDCQGKPTLSNQASRTFRAREYSLPEEVHEYIEGLLGVVDLPFETQYMLCMIYKNKVRTMAGVSFQDIDAQLSQTSTVANPAASGSTIPNDQLPVFFRPSSLNTYYDIFTNDGMNTTTQSILALDTQGMSAFDLSLFQRYFYLGQETIANDVGGYVFPGMCPSSNPCVEGNLDSQYIMAIAQNVSTTFWHANSSLGGEAAFASWLQYLEDDPYPPLVNSASYCSIEEYISFTELNSFNTEAMKLGLRGVTLLAAAGDWGVTGFENTLEDCGYTALFPASNPYVVSVGGTQGSTEVACQGNMYGVITTGGGFSSYYSQPAYQKSDVVQYFTEANPYSDPAIPGQSYNRSNRGYPDVSAQAAYYSIMYNGLIYPGISGTSASTPVTGGMFSLINAARKIAGQSPLGFVQPLLYSQAGAFIKDIVSGNNSCLESTDGYLAECCPVQGYTAQEGWDPVTGLGSINFRNFYSIAVSSMATDDDDSSSDSNNITAGQQAAVGISVAVIVFMFIASLLFVLELPVASWLGMKKTVTIDGNHGSEMR